MQQCWQFNALFGKKYENVVANYDRSKTISEQGGRSILAVCVLFRPKAFLILGPFTPNENHGFVDDFFGNPVFRGDFRLRLFDFKCPRQSLLSKQTNKQLIIRYLIIHKPIYS